MCCWCIYVVIVVVRSAIREWKCWTTVTSLKGPTILWWGCMWWLSGDNYVGFTAERGIWWCEMLLMNVEECVSHVVLFGDKKFWGSQSRWKKRDEGSRKVLCGWNVVVCEKMTLAREHKEEIGLCMVVQWKRCWVICGVIDVRVAKIEVMTQRVWVYNGGEMLRFLWKK